MDAVLRPNRSLSAQGFKIMFGVLVAMNLGVALYFWFQGAYPVLGFLGLDVLAVWIAFRVNYRSGRAEERVRVAPDHIHIERRSPNGAAAHWVVSSAWAKAWADSDAVAIRSGGKSLRVGAFLSPPERKDFARAFNEALWKAQRTPYNPSTSSIE